MRFGCRCEIEQMTDLADAGYEYAEMSTAALYPALDDEAFRHARHELLGEPLFPEVIRWPELVAWAGDSGRDLRTLFRRAALNGCKTIVAAMPSLETPLGLGHPTTAWREATEVVGVLGEHAARVRVKLALEAAAGGTVEEAWVLAEEAGHAAVGVAMDLSQVNDLADIAAAEALLMHVSLPAPRRHGGDLDSTQCMDALEHLVQFGYRGRVTITTPWEAIRETADELLDEMKRLTSTGGA
ncbi:MAG TPA: TIM barrel protein [Armatimonadota bacterium]|nr:TIM barrel protein [Armatimonadota bacterium]